MRNIQLTALLILTFLSTVPATPARSQTQPQTPAKHKKSMPAAPSTPSPGAPTPASSTSTPGSGTPPPPPAVTLRPASGTPPPAVTPEFTRTVIDSLHSYLYHNYVFPDTALKMTAYLEEQYKKGVYKDLTTPRQLAQALQTDLQKAHHDGHLHLNYNPGLARGLSDTVGMAEKRRINDSIGVADMRERNFMVTKAEVLPGNIGYLSFSGFTGFIEEARPTFTAAFRFLANTSAIIIDLRHNGGGSPGMVSQVESYFFAQRTHLNDIVNTSENRTITMYADPANADNLTLKMPVYVLTGKRTFSGAEDFAYGMQSVKRAVIVGDTTGGGAHPTRPFDIGMGFVADIPFARSLNPYTHTDWEGTGVIPDIPVTADRALEVAQNAIFQRAIDAAPTERARRQARWQLNKQIAEQGSRHPEPGTLASCTGLFEGGLDFHVEGKDLICRNAERGNGEFRTLFIEPGLFQLDEDVQVQFTKDANGRTNGIKMC